MNLGRSSGLALTAAALAFLVSGPGFTAADPGSPPVANAGGPYLAECQGAITAVPLDGTGSYDPDGTPLSFWWHEECPDAYIDDPASPTPNLIVTGTGCAWNCPAIELNVTSGGQTTKDKTQADVVDTTPPNLVPPGDVYQPWGIDTQPNFTGWPRVNDLCSPNSQLSLGYKDVFLQPNQLGMERIIERTWVSEDGCGNVAKSVQRIHLLGPTAGGFNLEVDPTACSDSFSMSGPSPAFEVILAGSAKLDVEEVDLGTLHFSILEFACGCLDYQASDDILAADEVRYVATAPDQCNPLGVDGYADLQLVLNRAGTCTTMQLAGKCNGPPVRLTVAGQRYDGSWFWAATEILVEN